LQDTDHIGTGAPPAALILANHPIPLQADGYYYEIEILSSGDTGYIFQKKKNLEHS
jgi:hypothetical protein